MLDLCGARVRRPVRMARSRACLGGGKA